MTSSYLRNLLPNAADNPEEIPQMAAPVTMSGKVDPHDTLTMPLGPPTPEIGTDGVTESPKMAKPSPLDEQESGMQDKLAKMAPKPYEGDHPRVHSILNGLKTAGNIAGDVFAPGTMALIPGTQLHNDIQKRHLESGIEGIEQEKSKEGLEGAQTREANAKADAAANPQPKPDDYDLKEVVGPDGSAIYAAVSKHDPNDVHPIPTMKVPPKDAAKHLEHSTLQGPDGKPMAANFDPSTGAYTDATGKPVANPRPYEKPQNVGVTVVVPDGKGGNKVERLSPGQDVAPGSVTPNQFGAGNEKATATTAAEQKAAKDAQNEYALAQTLAANPSPTNDLALVMRYIGATKPDSLGKLRLNQNEIALVFGTRSSFGDFQALIQKVQNGQSLTPHQREDMLSTMKLLSDSAGDKLAGGGGTPPPGAKVRDYTQVGH